MNEYSALRVLKKRLIEYKKLYPNLSKAYYVGAVILDRSGSIVSTGFNSFTKSHPKQKSYSEKISVDGKCNQIWLHAELAALVKCHKSVPYTIIVARIGKDDSIFRLAKPCNLCMAAIKESSLKRVYYTNDDGYLVLGELS